MLDKEVADLDSLRVEDPGVGEGAGGAVAGDRLPVLVVRGGGGGQQGLHKLPPRQRGRGQEKKEKNASEMFS